MRLKKLKTSNDIQLIRQYFHQIFPEEPHYDLADFDNSITGKHAYLQLDYYVAYDGADMVGFCGIYAKEEMECWLGWFGIRPEFRRRGFACGMLNRLFQKMAKQGYRLCRVYTDKVINHNAYLMYEKAGFTEDSRYENDFVTMVKALDDKAKITKWVGVPLGFESETPYHYDEEHCYGK